MIGCDINIRKMECMSNRNVALVAVVIPCYCCAGTIRRAVDSILRQTIKPAEVILVDDASCDNTLSLLHELEQLYPGWIQVIVLPVNSGAATARNAGWEVATQPYIAFLDSDDAWHPKKIEIQYAYMRTHPEVELCGHEYRRLAPDDGLPNWSVSECIVQPVSKWGLILSNKFVTPSAMVRRDIAPRFVDSQRHMEDHMLWLKVIFGGGKVVKLTSPLVAIYKRPFGITGLSAQFWPMERGELGNYRRLYRSGYINGLQWGALVGYSILKYVRRLVIYWSYLRWKR